LLGPDRAVFGTAILGANYGGGESHTYTASAKFDFSYGGDLLLGLIDNQSSFAGTLGFQSIEFTVMNGSSDILDLTFANLISAEGFFSDFVIPLGSYAGAPIDLTFGYKLIAEGAGGFGVDLAFGGAVPEPSSWALILVGFSGLAGLRLRKRPLRA
jgi:PEP-CTERM motif